MNKQNCYQVGHVTKTHGLKGEVVIFLDVDTPDDYVEMDSIFVEIKGQLIPYFVENINLQKDSRAIVKFEDVLTIEQAKVLVGCPLFLPDDVLDELGEGDFYYHEIIGFNVEDEVLGTLGKVETVYEGNTQDLVAMRYQGCEVLIPINDDIVKNADKTTKVLHVCLPDGLIDLYTNLSTQKPDDED